MNIAEQTRFKIMLLAHQEELQELDQSARHSAPRDFNETIILSQLEVSRNHLMDQETQRRRTQNLTKVSDALQRIANGSYGRCVQCERDIDLHHLEGNPSTTHCTRCLNN